MSDTVKLIVDIPESLIQELKDGCFGVKHSIYELEKCILNGTPLDKIKAEIQENIDYNKKMNYLGIVSGLLLALDIIDYIIDKYKTESEET